MVATDIAGRGLDFNHVSHVINYDYPYGLDSYINRTGRTGRMGRSGIAMTFVTDHELGDLKFLFKMNRIDPMWHGKIPDLQNISRRKENGKYSFKKHLRKTPSYVTPTVQRSDFTKGDEWQRPLMKSA
jgi:ATP-dependent RNA helicase DeaD